MLSSINLWCISKLVSRYTYSELMMQGIDESGDPYQLKVSLPSSSAFLYQQLFSISGLCTITILAFV